MIKLGLDCKLMRGTAGTTATTEMKNVKNVTLNLEKAEADITTRAASGWRVYAGTLKEASIEFEMLYDTEDEDFTTILNAFLNGTVLSMFVSDGSGSTVLSENRKLVKTVSMETETEDMDALLDDGMWTDGYEDVLERTIITTFYETGIRLAELIGIDDSDVRLEQRELRVLGKRNKERVIPFGESLEETFNTYIQARDSEVTRTDSAFFSNTKGRRVSRGQVMTMVRRQLSRVTTQKKRSPHVLRHTFATAMLNNDANIESLKKLLGHESVATTARYAHTTFEQLKRVYKNAHPRA